VRIPAPAISRAASAVIEELAHRIELTVERWIAFDYSS